ncbi:MAG: hypothetical protein GQ538_07005 [Xanthomonadales bacterium]|nr:hypothetical protein [Xanthomonadales bacterium]
MKRLLLFAPLILFGVAGSWFLYIFLMANNEGAFQNSLLPELIGFCLEGFFLVGLFSLIQRRLERERKNELRESLRGALRDILSHLDIALLEDNAEPAKAESLDLDPEFVKALFAKLHKNELDLQGSLNIKEAAKRNFGTMHDLIPVAAQLSANHMRWWLAIAESVRRLSEGTDKADINYVAQKFLMNLGEFDQLSL